MQHIIILQDVEEAAAPEEDAPTLSTEEHPGSHTLYITLCRLTVESSVPWR